MRKRERVMVEKAFIELEKAFNQTESTVDCFLGMNNARMLLNKVLKEDKREKARLAKKGRRVVNK